MSASALESLLKLDLDQEWQAIEAMNKAGIKPSAERIREYAQASSALGRIAQDRERILACISDILRKEETCCDSTEPVLRDVLVVLESMGSERELKEAFIGKVT